MLTGYNCDHNSSRFYGTHGRCIQSVNERNFHFVIKVIKWKIGSVRYKKTAFDRAPTVEIRVIHNSNTPSMANPKETISYTTR